MRRFLPLAALLLPLPAEAQFQRRPRDGRALRAVHGPDGIAKDSEVPHLAGQNERYLINQLMAFRSGQGGIARCASWRAN